MPAKSGTADVGQSQYFPDRFSLYVIEFSSGKRYYGITNNLVRRSRQHRHLAKRGDQNPLYRAIRKYGLPPLRQIAVGARDFICGMEIKIIALDQTTDPRSGYNLSLGGDSPAMTAATRAKISRTWRGKKHSPEWYKNISRANRESPFTEARRLQLAVARRNIDFSDLARGRAISAAKLGHSVSLDTREKIRAKLKGRPRGW